MAYAALDDLLTRFGEDEVRELSDRCRPPLGQVDAQVCQRALDDADGVINRYLGARYAVPLTSPWPADIVRIACDIARYVLHDLAAPDNVRRHYDDAIAWLKMVGEGKLPLVGADGALIAQKDAQSSLGMPTVLPYASGAVFGDDFAQRIDPAVPFATGSWPAQSWA